MIRKAKFICSSERNSQMPKDSLPEFAFIGRSNVGKSSLVNMLCGNSSLAKVSSTPGKTKLVNHFLINDEWYLVDLPGYGYARTSKGVQRGFSKLITSYVSKRETLHCLFVLVDSRLEPQKIDMEFLTSLGEAGIPFAIILTKCDKQSKSLTARSVSAFEKALGEMWDPLPPMFLSSSEKGTGRDEIIGYIEQIIKN